ncbi:EthD family reductase [Desulfopila sp. IMCC35008]|uniref:EthD family reductase n=1 Tax=Desulfopila sp. IMCC35008 TaxID=2653858 RepID=UPI002714C444|nr:EthD family reductase [Desulfopila sp. IMCC35008]
MIKEALGTALKGIEFETGISGRESSSSPSYVAIGHMYFDSVEEYRNAMGYHVEKMKRDIHKFTNVMPIIQIGEVRLSSVPEINLSK